MLAFQRRPQAIRFAAVTANRGGLCLAAVAASAGGKMKLPVCEFFPLLDEADETSRWHLLKNKLREFGLDKVDLASSLALGDYTLLSVDAPDVPPNELRAAVRWQIKDLIDFHIDDAVLDVFDTPATGLHGQQKSIYVVVLRRSQLERRISPFHAANARLSIVDIPELALRNIAANLVEDERGVVMVYFSEQRGVLTLTKQATMYLARSLDFGIEQLVGEAGRQSLYIERLSLEIQRSLDYYDRYFNQAPIRDVIISPLADSLSSFCPDLENQLGLKCRFLDLREIVELDHDVSSAVQQQCLLAVGAALRREPRKL